MVNSTIEELVLYMYNESDNNSSRQTKKALEDNWALNEKFKVIRESAERLSSMKLMSPRQESIDAIMKYAAATSNISSSR